MIRPNACLRLCLSFFAPSELQSRRSHIAFTIARKVRRNGFRWAIRESRNSFRNEVDATEATLLETESGVEDSHSHMLLEQFLDRCQRRGWLSAEERQLLIQFKLERISGPELARRTGLSVVAIRHRIQRVLDRLRRIARNKVSVNRSSLTFSLDEFSMSLRLLVAHVQDEMRRKYFSRSRSVFGFRG